MRQALAKRLLTAGILAPVVVLCVLHLPTTAVLLLLGLFLVAAAWEWTALVQWQDHRARIIYVVAVAGGALAISRLNEERLLFLYLSIAAVIWWLAALLILILAELKQTSRFMRWNDKGSVGMLVLLAAWAGVDWLLENDRMLLLVLFAMVWMADAGAYCCGKLWGRRRLAPQLSPGKTWEGLFGGFVAGLAVVIAMSGFMVLSSPAARALLVLASLSIGASVVGDLFESLLKRRIGVKDSGGILPGHGGVLDRIDGLIAALPVFVLGIYFWVGRL